MPLIKLAGPRPPAPADGGAPRAASPAQAASPAPSAASIGAPKLKLKSSQPPTPATEQPGYALATASSSKKAVASKASGSKKRSANDELASAPKRVASGANLQRKPSILKIKPVTAPPGHASATPLTAGGVHKLKIGGPRKQSTPRVKALTTHNIRREIPKRETGVGYDSEDSEREEDPAVQQA